MKRIVLPLSVLAVSCSQGAGNPPPETSEGDNPIASAVDFGGCAPVRYREIEPGELRPDGHRPRVPPRPVRVTVQSLFTTSAQRGISKRISQDVSRAKTQILRCISDELDESDKYLRLSVLVHPRGARVQRLSNISDNSRRRCAEKAITDKLSTNIRHNRSTYLSFNIRISGARAPEPKPPGPERRPGTVEVLSNSDRVPEGLALSENVVGQRAALVQCLAKHKHRGNGRASALLTMADGEVSAAEVSIHDGAQETGDCMAKVLSGLAADKVSDGGFECALSFGDSANTKANLVLGVDRAGLILADGGRVAVDLAATPPESELYKALLRLRFDDVRPSPAPAVIVAEPSVAGEALVKLTSAAAAADIQIAGVVVTASPTSESKHMLTSLPNPRMSSFSGRPARLSAVVSDAGVWLGLSATGEDELLTDANQIASRIKELAGVAGMQGRRDALIGIESDASAAALIPALTALTKAGFVHIELASAESARARLAR